MNGIINLGNPLKDMLTICPSAASQPEQKMMKITGVRVLCSGDLFVTSPLYGVAMVQDCLEELWGDGLFTRGSRMILVGSMGGLRDSGISLDEIVLPNPSMCAYFDYRGRELYQDAKLIEALKGCLQARGSKCREYRHGSSFAVYDPHMDHKIYRSSLYDETVLGLDCGEVFIGLEFAQRKAIRAAAVLYCSDTWDRHIGDLPDGEFQTRARENDQLLNTIAAQVLTHGE